MKLSHLYVFLQLGIIATILLHGWFFSDVWYYLAIQIFGICLVIWSVFEMRKSKINVSPELREGAKLIRSGPYRIIRHPMYLATLIFILPLILDYFTIGRLALFTALIITLNLKLTLEEKLLTESFPDYENYKKSSWRMIPFIY